MRFAKVCQHSHATRSLTKTNSERLQPGLDLRSSEYLSRFVLTGANRTHRRASLADSGTSQGWPDRSLRTRCRISTSLGHPLAAVAVGDDEALVDAIAPGTATRPRCRSLLLCRTDSYMTYLSIKPNIQIINTNAKDS